MTRVVVIFFYGRVTMKKMMTITITFFDGVVAKKVIASVCIII
jgi:TfoX/Sxy family transcriptional regulator of competence genes